MSARSSRVIYKADPRSTFYTPASLRSLAVEIQCGPPILDPCTHASNPMKAVEFFTIAGRAGSLKPSAWAGELLAISGPPTVWLNPPYGREIGEWMRTLAECRRLVLASTRRPFASLALVPARPGSQWYKHATRTADLVCELDGRVTFEQMRSGGRLKPCEFPARWASALLWSGPAEDRARVAALLRTVGAVRRGNPRIRRVRPPRSPAPNPTHSVGRLRD